MSFDGFLSYGGIELINAARTTAYVDSLLPGFPLVRRGDLYDHLAAALGDDPYVSPVVDGAEWLETDNGIDPRNPSHSFYGLYPLEIKGIGGSTMQASITEGVTDGGTINSQRDATRSIRVRALAIGADQLSVEAGLTWIRNALRTNGCGQHGDLCGYRDLRYFLAPPAIDPSCPPEAQDPYELESIDRTYHRAGCTTGMSRIRDLTVSVGAATEIDFIITAGNPHAFSTQSVEIPVDPAATPILIADEAVNLLRWPSMEAAGAAYVDQANFCTNPSAEAATTGYTAIPGTTGVAAVTNPTSTTAFGVKVARCTWSTASTAAGGGMYIEVSRPVMPGGSGYDGEAWNVQVNHVKSSITQRLKLRIEWRDGVTSFGYTDGPEFVATAGVVYNPKIENVISPSPTGNSIRVTVVSVAGTSYANWSIGSYLEMDAVMVNPGTVGVMPYFDGNTGSSSDYTYSWVGTTNLSVSYRNGVRAAGMDTAPVNGGNASRGRSVLAAHSGTYGNRVTAFAPMAALSRIWATSNLPAEAIAIDSGGRYSGSVWVRSSIDLDVFLSIYWYNELGVVVGLGSAGYGSLVANEWVRLSTFWGSLTPVGAVYATLSVENDSGATIPAGTIFDFDDAMYNFGDLMPYFDGNTVDGNGYDYVWDGVANQSTSRRTFAIEEPNVIIDPDLPAIPTPPSPPSIPDVAITPQTNWLRYYVDIPASEVGVWVMTIPTISLSTLSEDVRQVRVRFYPNTFDRAIEDVDPLSYCGEFLLSYLPSNSMLTVSGVSETAWAQVAGGEPIPANQLLYGTGGTPMSYPELSCGVGYYMTIDIPPTAAIENLDLQLSVNRRE